MPKTPVAVVNRSLSKMINQFRYAVGKFYKSFYAFDITGTDRESFLQNQSTFNVATEKNQSFHLASFLDPQGRIECYGWLLKSQDKFIYLVPQNLKEAAIERMNRFLISEDVTISSPLWNEWTFILGPGSVNFFDEYSYEGEIFGETCFLCHEDPWDVPVVPEQDVELWMGLTGWPSFDGDDFKKELVTNLGLFETSVSANKGCYPGQETVSKISSRRGAAFSPVLIEVETALTPGGLYNFDKKIGEVHKIYQWMGQYYLSATLIRDFRVEGLSLSFSLNDESLKGIVRYFPLLPGSILEKAKELYYEGLEFFKKNNFESAEECLKLSIKLDPTFADAYESLGVLLGRLERFSEAIKCMESLIEIDPKSVLAHTNMSLFLMRSGKIEAAEQHKAQATLKSFAKFGEEAQVRDKEASRKKELESEWLKRESMFRQVLEIDPEDTLANYGLGSIAVEKKDWAMALNYLEKVILADPHYSVAYVGLGKALKALNRMEEARSIWQKGVKVAASKGDLMPANQMQAELDNL